jgi:hypothetical protein
MLKEMSSYRASAHIDNYLDAAKQVVSVVNRYETGKNGFRTFYTEIVKPYLEKLETEEKQATPAIPTPESTQMGKQEVGAEPATSTTQPAAPIPESFVQPGASPIAPPTPKMPTVSVLPAAPAPAHDTDPSPPPNFKSEEEAKKLEKMMGIKSSQEFVQYLESMSQEDPRFLASFIRKYASSIQQDSPSVAIKLFHIAKSLRS